MNSLLPPTLMMLLRRGRPPGLLSRGRGQAAGLGVEASAAPRGSLAGLARASSPDTPRLQSPLETPPLSQRACPCPMRPPPPPPPPPSPAPAFRAPLAPRTGPGEVGRAPPAAPPRLHSAMGAPRPASTKPRPRVPASPPPPRAAVRGPSSSPPPAAAAAASVASSAFFSFFLSFLFFFFNLDVMFVSSSPRTQLKSWRQNYREISAGKRRERHKSAPVAVEPGLPAPGDGKHAPAHALRRAPKITRAGWAPTPGPPGAHFRGSRHPSQGNGAPNSGARGSLSGGSGHPPQGSEHPSRRNWTPGPGAGVPTSDSQRGEAAGAPTLSRHAEAPPEGLVAPGGREASRVSPDPNSPEVVACRPWCVPPGSR